MNVRKKTVSDGSPLLARGSVGDLPVMYCVYWTSHLGHDEGNLASLPSSRGTLFFSLHGL